MQKILELMKNKRHLKERFLKKFLGQSCLLYTDSVFESTLHEN